VIKLTETSTELVTASQGDARTRAFSTRKPPWMTVGTVIDRDDVSSKEAIELGGLDFDVELHPVAWRPDAPSALATDDGDAAGQLADEELAKIASEAEKRAGDAQAMRVLGRHVPDLLAEIARLRGGTDRRGAAWSDIPNRRAAIHGANHSVMDIVSTDYAPVQYREAFAFLDELNGARYVAAGQIHGGRQGFMVVQVPGTSYLDIEVAGEKDPHDLYAICRTSHDRSRGLQVFLMPLRHRCMNQLPLTSFGMDAVQSWSIRHIGNPTEKLEEAVRVIKNLGTYAAAYENMVRQLAETDVLLEDAERVLKSVIKDLPKRDEQIGAIVAAWQSSPHVGFEGTAWGLVNGVSEYFSWQRESKTRTEAGRFTGEMEGMTARYVSRTAQVLLNRRR
jgi:hypothetical protein